MKRPPGAAAAGWGAGRRLAWALGVAFLLSGPAAAAAAGDPESDYAARIEAWRAERDSSLRRPHGWLSLAGLFPLSPGAHSVGSAAGSHLRFPTAAPARLGVMTVDTAGVRFTPGAGVEVTVAGDTVAPVEGALPLLADTDTGGPTRLGHGSFNWWIIARSGSPYLRLSDADNPVLKTFTGVACFPVDPAWRRPARRVAPEPGRTLTVPTVLGTASTEASGGWLEFEIDGATHRLEVPADEAGYFVIFGDATNGEQTYGGGRFLWIERPAAGDSLVIDFNRAYNPPCAFTPYATCPLPPPGNVLPLAVRAGEKAYGGH